MAEPPKLVSRMGWATPDAVYVRGHNLCEELLGRVSLGDVAFLELTGRLPNPDESAMVNALLVVLVEHGITPNVLAARLTFIGAPDAFQGAVAAGLLGAGSVVLGAMEEAAQLLQEATPRLRAGDSPAAVAAEIVATYLRDGRTIPGIGHPIHQPEDPRAVRLFAIARERGVYGPHCDLMQTISAQAQQRSGKSLPVNAPGAVAGIASDMGFSWRMVKGFALIGRTVGLVGHLAEEMEKPITWPLYRWAKQVVRHDG